MAGNAEGDMQPHTWIRLTALGSLSACWICGAAASSAVTGGAAGVLTAADRLEIQELINRYAVAEDSGDVDDWVGTFTVDGVFKPPEGTIIGREALRAFIIARLKRAEAARTLHWVGNSLVKPSAEGAHALSYETVIERMGDGTFRIRSVETKHDELRRENGHWRFKSRFNTPWPADLPKPPLAP
jgi:hypothetical protein